MRRRVAYGRPFIVASNKNPGIAAGVLHFVDSRLRDRADGRSLKSGTIVDRGQLCRAPELEPRVPEVLQCYPCVFRGCVWQRICI